MRRHLLRCAVSALLATGAALAQDAPRHVLFTWRGDTGTTLLVTYHTFSPKKGRARVFYDTVPHGGVVEDYPQHATGTTARIPGLKDRFVHHVELTGLRAGTTVYLCAGDPELGISREYKVRTIADDGRPLRFVTGGDMGPSVETRLLLRQAARTSPDFALIGGDIAYANGKVRGISLWDTWLTYYSEEMVTPTGFSVPVALAIGNHEVDGGYGQPAANAPFYFGLFGQDGRSYFSRRFGRDLLVLLLDSGHVAPHAGAQTQWIESELKAQSGVRFKAAIYHVPLYPSHRVFDAPLSALGRMHWAPLFDALGLTVAFENHDHTFKRSRPLRGGKVADGGVLYLGDGCFGRPPRAVRYGGRWYLDKQATTGHFWAVEVAEGRMTFRAVDRRGRVFDVHPATAPGAVAAAKVFAELRPRYMLPPESVSIDPLARPTETWREGVTEVRVQNPFAVPIEVRVALRQASEGIRAEVGAAVRAKPGKVARVKVRLFADRGIAFDQVLARLKVTCVLRGADKVKLESTLLVPRAR